MSDSPDRSRSRLGSFNDVLQHPGEAVERLETPGRGAAGLLILGGLAGGGVYGLAAGFFQGGGQVATSAVKAPVVILLSLALCLPSLYVFASLAGGPFNLRRFAAAVAGFAALLGILLAGLAPINWLFSVSARYLLPLVLLHFALWVVTVALALRFVIRALPQARAAIAVWAVLFVLVSLQVATYLRPVLWREPGAPWVESGKMFFLEHFERVDARDDEVAREAKR